MAIESVTLNPGLADWGSKILEKRACVTCHTIGEVKQGPDLTGVAKRRTVTWMKRQITASAPPRSVTRAFDLNDPLIIISLLYWFSKLSRTRK